LPKKFIRGCARNPCIPSFYATGNVYNTFVTSCKIQTNKPKNGEEARRIFKKYNNMYDNYE